MPGVTVARLILDEGESLIGKAVLGPSGDLYLILGVNDYGFEIYNLDDITGKVPTEGLIMPVKTVVTLANDTTTHRYKERIKKIKAKYGLNQKESKEV